MSNLEFSFNSLQLSHLKNKFAISVLVHDRRDGAVKQAEEKAGHESRSAHQHSVPGGVQRCGKGPRDGRAGATFIGSFDTDALSALFAAAQLESLYAALVVSIGLNLLQFVIDSYIEPRVAGTAVSISPFMVVCRIPIGQALGDSRRLYRRADPDRARNGLCKYPGARPIAPALGGWGSMQMKIDG